MRTRSGVWGPRSIQAGFLVLLVLLWLWIGWTGAIPPIFVPPLDGVVVEFVRIILTGEVMEHLSVTLREIAVAYALSIGLGLAVGFAIGRSRYAVAIFEPLLAGIFAVPIVIFLPLFLLFLGIGPESKMAFGATYAFFPVVLNTIGGVGQVDQRLVTVARSLGATDWQMFRRVLLPAALPVIFTGLRMAIIIGFLAIIGAEMIAGFSGLGSEIVRLAEGMNTTEMFAYVLFVILIAVFLNLVLTRLQARIDRSSGLA